MKIANTIPLDKTNLLAEMHALLSVSILEKVQGRLEDFYIQYAKKFNVQRRHARTYFNHQYAQPWSKHERSGRVKTLCKMAQTVGLDIIVTSGSNSYSLSDGLDSVKTRAKDIIKESNLNRRDHCELIGVDRGSLQGMSNPNNFAGQRLGWIPYLCLLHTHDGNLTITITERNE